MDVLKHENTETYESDEDWERRSPAGSDQFSFEWFTKPTGHSSPVYDHENDQVCVIIEGELRLHRESESSITLESALLNPMTASGLRQLKERLYCSSHGCDTSIHQVMSPFVPPC